MRLLNTRTAVLQHFPLPDTRPPYAILSHVWRENEQSFQSVHALRTHSDPRSLLSDKLRQFCLFAQREGFDWVWVDSCCIDKTSSAELSEALNSMHAWYSAAAICYAYLFDVPMRGNPTYFEARFVRSVWFTRGWTLQELIAPPHIVFLSSEWSVIGTRTQWARVVERCTHVDRNVLTRRLPLHDVSIARRLSWAAGRRTTRPEDRAYALMGLFGVHMTVIYGEGEVKAFRRLQEEIIKQCAPDQTLFAWGTLDDYDATAHAHKENHDQVLSEAALDMRNMRHALLRSDDQPAVYNQSLLLATSPDCFEHVGNLVPASPSEVANVLGSRVAFNLDLCVAGFAVRITLPLIPLQGHPRITHLAVLACRDRTRTDSLRCLYLTVPPNQVNHGIYAVGEVTPDVLRSDNPRWRTFRYSRGGLLFPRTVGSPLTFTSSTIYVPSEPYRPLHIYDAPLSPKNESPASNEHGSPTTSCSSSVPICTLYFPNWQLSVAGLTMLPPRSSITLPEHEAITLSTEYHTSRVILAHIEPTFPGSSPPAANVSRAVLLLRLDVGILCPCSSSDAVTSSPATSPHSRLWLSAAWSLHSHIDNNTLLAPTLSSSYTWHDISRPASLFDAQDPDPDDSAHSVDVCPFGRLHLSSRSRPGRSGGIRRPGSHAARPETESTSTGRTAHPLSSNSSNTVSDTIPPGPGVLPYASTCVQFGHGASYVFRVTFDYWPSPRVQGDLKYGVSIQPGSGAFAAMEQCVRDAN